jgi:hypothetical protein
MSLRNKLMILNMTLMSLLTIPTRAENDTTLPPLRIENAEFVVDVTAPEGWAVTDEFEKIPAKVEFGGSIFRTLKFRNGTPSHGCVVLFTSDSDELNKEASLAEIFSDAYQLAFPGSVATSFTPSKINIDGSVKADIDKESIEISLGGSLEGAASTESRSASITASGNLEANPNSNLIMATGKVTFDDISGFGTIGLIVEDNYQVIIAAWGADEETLKNDVTAFSKALKFTPKEVSATIEAEEVATQEVKAAVDPVNPTTEVQG